MDSVGIVLIIWLDLRASLRYRENLLILKAISEGFPKAG
jgi:hypothetical protein